MPSLTIELDDSNFGLLTRKAANAERTAEAYAREIIEKSFQRKDVRPKRPSGTTELVFTFVEPFIRKVQFLDTSREDTREIILEALRPANQYFLQMCFPELSPAECDRNLRQAFQYLTMDQIKECKMMAVNLRKMIRVASIKDPDPDTDISDLNLWLKKHSGQDEYILRQWGYQQTIKILRPKQFGSTGDMFYDWTIAQVAALFIFWIRCAFDERLSDTRFTAGEYFLGVCKHCKQIFLKKTHDAKGCSPKCRNAI
ncbi:MAG: hypothetical protein HQM09_02540 [Candidatus Riflebacteria bacterium]|nr:hypothetical protein [Candidatus Riflebacteria bacterium]